MAERRKLEFFLLRYVPDAVKGEFVNIGLVMVEAPTDGAGFADVRFTRDWARVRCLDPEADIETLQALERDIRKQVVEVRNCKAVMDELNKSFSNLIQLSGAKGCLAEDPSLEIREMAGIYLEGVRAKSEHALTGRQQILAKMWDALEARGISAFMRPFPVAPYTGAGDSFKFDFSYVIGNQVTLLHAVSLKARVDTAVTLAARYPKIADALRNAKERSLISSLIAVVDDDLDKTKEEVAFALGMMQENQIMVSEVRQMPGIAEVARAELRA